MGELISRRDALIEARTFGKDVILIEGILLFTDKRIRDICNVKVFVDAPADERLLRVIKRDIIERGRNVEQTLDRYIDTVKPMHEQFIEPTKRFADIIFREFVAKNWREEDKTNRD